VEIAEPPPATIVEPPKTTEHSAIEATVPNTIAEKAAQTTTTASTEPPLEVARNLMEDLNRAQDLTQPTTGGSPRVSQPQATGGAVGVARGSSGGASASRGGVPGGVPAGFQFGGEALRAKKKTRESRQCQVPAPPPVEEEETVPDLQQGAHHLFSRNQMHLPADPREQSRNFEAFGIPEEKYYLSKNLGDGNCLFYVWLQFLHLLEAEQRYSNISTMHIAAIIHLRKMVWELGDERRFKDDMLLAKDDLVAYLQGGDASNMTEDGEIDIHQNSLKVSVWEEMQVFDRDLMYKDWQELKIYWKPHPEFPDDSTKFDPESYSEQHFNLQPNKCFVGPVLMEKYAHLHFRVIAFFLKIYRLGTEEGGILHRMKFIYTSWMQGRGKSSTL
jgi:hypothetical protein